MPSPRRRTARAPWLEYLEERCQPAVFGQPWADPANLTISFVPDGTDVIGSSSQLFQALDARMPQSQWQQQITAAFQQWANAASLGFSIVSDGGQPLGTSGAVQGDSRFGDIRIAAVPMSLEVQAITIPHDPLVAGTLSGDILLNSRVAFDAARLTSVLLQEFGHALGMPNSPSSASVMYEIDQGHQALSPTDIFSIQALYGLNPAGLVPPPAGQALTPLTTVIGSVTTTTDAWTITAPSSGAGSLVVSLTLPSGGTLPSVKIVDAQGREVPVEVMRRPGAEMILEVQRVEASATYTVLVTGTSLVPTAYNLTAGLPAGPGHIDTFGSGTLDSLTPTHTYEFHAAMTGLLRFDLSATGPGVQVTMTNSLGQTVLSLDSTSLTSSTLLLPYGQYTITVTALSPNGTSDYKLTGIEYSDPIGPRFTDMTMSSYLSPTDPMYFLFPTTFWERTAQNLSIRIGPDGQRYMVIPTPQGEQWQLVGPQLLPPPLPPPPPPTNPPPPTDPTMPPP